jgi:hypothetical protein
MVIHRSREPKIVCHCRFCANGADEGHQVRVRDRLLRRAVPSQRRLCPPPARVNRVQSCLFVFWNFFTADFADLPALSSAALRAEGYAFRLFVPPTSARGTIFGSLHSVRGWGGIEFPFIRVIRGSIPALLRQEGALGKRRGGYKPPLLGDAPATPKDCQSRRIKVNQASIFFPNPRL